MGKGDRKTAKGKRFNSSYGNSRKHVLEVDASAAATPAAKKAVTKAPAKKVVAKKTVAKSS